MTTEPSEMLNFVKHLFEANEDLNLILIGGLAAQEIYGNRMVRKSSDIDLLANEKDAKKFVKRMKKNGYEIFYNEDLHKYSIYNKKKEIHIDVYPDKIGKYSIKRLNGSTNIGGIKVILPEDLIGIKIYSYFDAKKGNDKHLIDIYTILIGNKELELDYFFKKVLPYVSHLTKVKEEEILEELYNGNKGAFNQFTLKEKRFIKGEMERILDEYKKYNQKHSKNYKKTNNIPKQYSF
jgi:hypothetical protein